MTPERYAEIQEAFLELRSLDQHVQTEKLAKLKASDTSLAEEVESMLAADQNAISFIDKPLVDRDDRIEIETQDIRQTSTSDDSTIETPTHIGPYRILQKIGEGGHGVVFMAEQLQPIRRKVAIKWIKRGMDSDMILARFEAEWQALAMMKHPSIANVIEAKSTESGQPYFVMELVHGIPIDEFCDQNKLDLSERLALFQQVCGAVHHAHMKGIIHRDIKPANVLITTDSGKPLAKVIDFGIAKALHMPLTEKTMFTEYGQIVGTLEYMSPEQALMSQTGIDVRSDVYSLGVLLYLLLTGETPVSRRELLRDGIWELKNILQSTQPPTPSTRITSRTDAHRWRDHAAGDASWARSVSGDLDWITMKAIAREPELRYDSAADFASDIGRFLQNDAIEARPPSRWYKFQKFVRRNRVVVAASTFVAIALVGSLIVVALGYAQSERFLNDVRDSNRKIERQKRMLESVNDELSRTVRQQSIETAWQSAMIGDYEETAEVLEKIPRDDHDSALKFFRSLAKQYLLPVFRRGFESNVRVVASDQVANRIAIINTASELEIWDAASLKLRNTIELPPAIYTAASFSDRESLLAASAGQTIVRVDLLNETVNATEQLRIGAVRDVAYDIAHESWWLTTGSNFLYQLSEAEIAQQAKVNLKQRIDKLSVSPERKKVAVGCIKGNVLIVDTEAPNQIANLAASDNEIAAIVISNASIFAADVRGNVFSTQVSEVKDSLNMAQILRTPSQPVAGTFASNKNMFSAQRDGSIWLLGEELSAIPLRAFPGAIRELAWLNSLGRLFVFHPSGQVSVMDRQEITKQRHLSALPEKFADGLAHLETNIVATSHTDHSIKVWNSSTGAQLLAKSLHAQQPLELDVNTDGSMLASVGLDRKMVLCRLPSLEPTHRLDISWGVRSAAFSPDGKLIAGPPDANNSQRNREGTIDIWNIETGIALKRLAGHQNWVLQMQFRDDSEFISLSVDGTVKLWSINSGECLRTIDFSAIGDARCMAINNQDAEVTIGHSDGFISKWNWNTGELVNSTIVASSPIVGLTFIDSACSSLMVAVEESEELVLLDRQLQTIARLKSGVGPIKAFRSKHNSILLTGKSGLSKTLKK